MQIDACSYDCSGGDLAAVWHDVSPTVVAGIKRATWGVEHHSACMSAGMESGMKRGNYDQGVAFSGRGPAANSPRFVQVRWTECHDMLIEFYFTPELHLKDGRII